MPCNSMYQMAEQVQLTLLPPIYLNLVVADGGGGGEVTPTLLFFGERTIVDCLKPFHTY